MRVLHVISSIDLRAGGPAVAMAGLAKAQHSAGLDVAVLATWRNGANSDVGDDLTHAGIHVTRVGPARGPLVRHRQIAPALRAEMAQADVVHIHGLWEEVQHQAARIARKLGRPYVITPHGMLTPWSLRQKWLKKKIYMSLRLGRDLRQASAIHYTTAMERDLVVPLKLAPPAIVETLGVELHEFENLPPKGSFRAKLPQVGDRKTILFLGRLHRGKGMEYLIPTLAQPALKSAMLVAVGPDSQGFRATLEQMAQKQGVADRLIFTGILRGVERIEALVDADVFALPSEHENFGIVVVEALACGTPVVISDGVAIHADISGAQVGSVVPVGDANALARELTRWCDHPDEHVAARARKMVWERFDVAAVGRRWVDHYARLTRS